MGLDDRNTALKSHIFLFLFSLFKCEKHNEKMPPEAEPLCKHLSKMLAK